MIRNVKRREKLKMTFADALMTHCTEVKADAANHPTSDAYADALRRSRPRASNVVAALLLDAARADPLAMASNVTVVVALTPGLTEAVKELLRVVWDRRLSGVTEFLSHPSRRKIVLVGDYDTNRLDDWLPSVSENAGGMCK